MARRMPVAAGAIALGILAGACGQSPSPPAPEGDAVVLEGRDEAFTLRLRLADDVVDAGQPIDLAATLTWEGPAADVTVWGSGGGPVSFTLKQLDGELEMEAVQTADCSPTVIPRGAPLVVPYRKSGGWTADDPNADFYRTFFADPVLRLPAGSWQTTVVAGGYLAPCDAEAPVFQIALEATFLVR